MSTLLRHSAHRASGVLVAVMLAVAGSGCGKTSNDLSAGGSNDPNGSGKDDGGPGTGARAGDVGGAPDASSSGGFPATGGNGGAPSSGGTSSTGGVTGVPGSGGASEAGGENPIIDSHAVERRQLSEAACSLADRFPCLDVISDPGGDAGAGVCGAQTEASSYQRYGTICWDEWVAHMNCGISRTDYCPCTDGVNNYCIINPQLNNFGNGCLETKAALDACERSFETFGTEKGAAGEFNWQVNPNGACQALSVEGNVVGRIGALCSGSPAGGQSCYCNANGHQVFDLVELTLNGGAYQPWFASDCRDVATQLAAGLCTDMLSCCFRYNWKTLDGQNVDTCGCGSDPSRAGYASCAEFAAAANGTIVPACVEWQTPGDFPISPKPP